VRPLPTSFGQGCLWGIVQGALAALIVLSLKRTEYFYLTMLMGFVFYVFAGFMTTRQGGSSLRGAWTGVWAGINSTVIFWLVLLVGLVVSFVQRWQKEVALARAHGVHAFSDLAGRVWHSVLPDFLLPSTSSQHSSTNLLFWLGGGLLIAFTLGWIGGILGKSRYKKSRYSTSQQKAAASQQQY
jgi:hypothetical protein